MKTVSDRIALDTPSLKLECKLVPWDEEAFGFRVAQIEHFEVRNRRRAVSEFGELFEWVRSEKVKMISCRLHHGRLRETFFLEERDFRFIEMVISPRLDNLHNRLWDHDTISIDLATAADVNSLAEIAKHAFGHERYHMDPRLERGPADERYANWVRRSLHHDSQRLLKISDGERVIGVFIVEARDGLEAYWHLTAIAPQWQGQGYGRRVWTAMLRRHAMEGHIGVTTNVSVRNVAVLNLYAGLGFKFQPPQITFHWLEESLRNH